MYEIVFNKGRLSFDTDIAVLNDSITMCLDTGSPITIICIPYLLQITQETYENVIKKINNYLTLCKPLEFFVYGTDISKEAEKNNVKTRKFIPYITTNCNIGGTVFPYFLFWVDITNYKDKKSGITTTLFGVDYIFQGKKYFDDVDNFHIVFDTLPRTDLKSIQYALIDTDKQIHKIEEIIGFMEK